MKHGRSVGSTRYVVITYLGHLFNVEPCKSEVAAPRRLLAPCLVISAKMVLSPVLNIYSWVYYSLILGYYTAVICILLPGLNQPSEILN